MMPEGWSNKDERKFEHIRDSNLERGMKQDRAREVAARTVNKDRREAGRTPNRRSQGTGNPNSSYDERSRDELYNIAKERDVAGRSRMTKAELIEALRK
jgi:plasmid stabilization system protein ParE